MTESPVNNLADLARLRGAPELLPQARDQLRQELNLAMAIPNDKALEVAALVG